MTLRDDIARLKETGELRLSLVPRLIAQVERVEAALLALRRDSAGLISAHGEAIRADYGNTNIACLEEKIVSADEALKGMEEEGDPVAEVKRLHEARERSVQGWAIVGPGGAVRIDTCRSDAQSAVCAAQYLGHLAPQMQMMDMLAQCQPVTITINAAAQEGVMERQSTGEKLEQQPSPAPAAMQGKEG